MARKKKLDRAFNRIELNYSNLTTQINDWLKSVYKKSGILFNSASPYGQILTVVKEFFVQNILYLKNFVKQLDIDQSTSVRMIRNIARISGHNPSRAISAKGTLKFKLKQGANITEKIAGSQITIYNNTVVKNKTNSLYYTLKVDSDKNYYYLTPGCQFFINTVQGKYEYQTFTGDGTIAQSFQVNVSENTTIDNFDFKVTLNGINLEIKDHLYDMLPNEYACYTRTGFNGGLDVYFGNDNYGIVPPIGSIIQVEYLLTNGLIGNILNNKINDFSFVDDVYDSDGNSIQVSQFFDIFIETNIQFASDGEDLEYTKSVIPYVSRNFVLATPSQFIYHLKKLNMFSKVNAFNTLDIVKIDLNNIQYYKTVNKEGQEYGTWIDQVENDVNINEMYLYLIPRITDYFSTDINYYNVPLNAFDLDDIEKARIIQYLKMQGIISITSSIKIINPKKKMFVVNVFVRRFDDVEESNIRESIVNLLSTYFAEYSRYDRVVKSDIIAALKTIDGIDSLNIEFIGKDNEDYHRDGALLSSNQQPVIQSTYVASTNSINISSEQYRNVIDNRISSNNDQINASDMILDRLGMTDSVVSVGGSSVVAYKSTQEYDAKKMVGIDPTLGDIVIGQNELVILRGGWRNRNGVFFGDDPNTTTGFSTVNIIWKGTSNRK